MSKSAIRNLKIEERALEDDNFNVNKERNAFRIAKKDYINDIILEYIMETSSPINLERDIRALELGLYIIDEKSTIRGASNFFGVPKSTTYTDVTERLKGISSTIHQQAHDVIINNKEQRSYRGGQATKKKHMKK